MNSQITPAIKRATYDELARVEGRDLSCAIGFLDFRPTVSVKQARKLVEQLVGHETDANVEVAIERTFGFVGRVEDDDDTSAPGRCRARIVSNPLTVRLLIRSMRRSFGDQLRAITIVNGQPDMGAELVEVNGQPSVDWVAAQDALLDAESTGAVVAEAVAS